MIQLAQRRASANVDRLRGIAFDLAPWPALIFSDGDRLVAANEAAEQLFGQDLATLFRARLSDLSPTLARVIERARREQTVLRDHEAELALPGRATLTVDASAAPIGDGTVLLTMRPRGADTGAPEPTDSPALAGLSGMLAHEIKNPLAGIRGAAQLLKSGVPAADAALAQLIMDEVDRIHRLVDSMAAFADPVRNVAQHAPVNIHAVLDRVRALAVNGVAGGVSLHESFDPSLPSTPGDEDQLIQVFLNLVKNAAEATEARGDGRGEIMLTTRYVQGFRMRDAAGRWRATPLEVRVQDNGPGVPEPLRAHLFEPFVTSKPQGAGLGLPLVARLISAHGGLIEFESEPGRTVFRVRLPICDDNRPRREAR